MDTLEYDDMPLSRTDLHKIAAATTVVADVFGGRVNVLFLMKSLYLADREVLKEDNRTITGDRYVSMNHGPVLSDTYNLVRGCLNSERYPGFQDDWNRLFRRSGNAVIPIARVKTDCLSEFEEDVLRAKAKYVSENKQNIVKILHDSLAEWTDPDGSSFPIPIDSILSDGFGLKSNEVERRARELAESKQLRSLDALSAEPLGIY